MTRADIVILAAALGLLPFLYAWFWTLSPGTGYAEIMAGEGRYQRVPLHIDRTLRIEGTRGPSVLEIRDGKIRFTESSCRDRICIATGWIEEGGEVAACLPNEVLVRVESRDPRYDAINH